MRTTKAILAAVVVALLAALATKGGTEAQELRFERAPTNAFIVFCEPRQPKPIDPILYYGQTNSSHLHAPFGGRFDPYSDYRYLRDHGTTCADDAHKSLYWNPTVERETTGERIPATELQAYYRAVEGTPTADLRPPPKGVKLIAGFGTATEPQYGVVDWGCGSPFGQGDGPDGKIRGYLRPVDCDPNSSNPLVKAIIHFPNCFTGARDSSDHRSHAAYPVGYPEDPAAWRCPDGYPIRSPRLDYTVKFATSDADNLALSSGPPESMHADWIHAANQARFQARIDAKLAGG